MIKIIVSLFCALFLLAPVAFAQDVIINDESTKIDSTKIDSAKVDSAKVDSAEIESTNIEISGVDHNEVESANAEILQSKVPVVETTPQVGKHVMANMDASSMIVSLLMVLALIIISAFVLKRFNLTQQSSSHLKIVASLSLGAKERIIVLQIGEQQLVLGVCPQQISLLKDLEEPIDIHADKPLAISKNVLSFLQKNTIKTDKDSNTATNGTTNNK